MFENVGDAPADYAPVLRRLNDRQTATDNKQPGDPAIAAERIVDLVRHEGRFKDLSHSPFRLFLGSDCLDIIRKRCEDTLSILEQQDVIARSTDFAENSDLEQYS